MENYFQITITMLIKPKGKKNNGETKTKKENLSQPKSIVS